MSDLVAPRRKRGRKRRRALWDLGRATVRRQSLRGCDCDAPRGPTPRRRCASCGASRGRNRGRRRGLLRRGARARRRKARRRARVWRATIAAIARQTTSVAAAAIGIRERVESGATRGAGASGGRGVSWTSSSRGNGSGTAGRACCSCGAAGTGGPCRAGGASAARLLGWRGSSACPILRRPTGAAVLARLRRGCPILRWRCPILRGAESDRKVSSFRSCRTRSAPPRFAGGEAVRSPRSSMRRTVLTLSPRRRAASLWVRVGGSRAASCARAQLVRPAFVDGDAGRAAFAPVR